MSKPSNLLQLLQTQPVFKREFGDEVRDSRTNGKEDFYDDEEPPKVVNVNLEDTQSSIS